jgi:hypothetical protein
MSCASWQAWLIIRLTVNLVSTEWPQGMCAQHLLRGAYHAVWCSCMIVQCCHH